MGRLIETRQNYFGKGISNFLRSKIFEFSRLVSNLDIYSDPTKMTPYRDFQDDAITSLTLAESKLCKFVAGPNSGATGTIQYALGVVSGTTRAKIFSRSTAVSNWEATANGIDTTTGISENLFVIYNGVLWGANGSNLWSYTISTDTLLTNAQALTYTQIFQGLVHSKDNVLYVPYISSSASYIASKNGAGAWNVTALTLPSSMIPISISEDGNYLAVACKQRNIQSGPSVVFLWDRDSSLTTLSESINWGPESLEMIEEIDGTLVGVSVFANTSSEAFTVTPKIIFKFYESGFSRAHQFLEIPLTSSTVNANQLPTVNLTGGVAITKQKINNRILFNLSCEINNVQYDAIWAIARLPDGSFSISIDRLINNGTALTANLVEPKGFIQFGDYVTTAFEDNGTYKATRTINAATYTQTAFYETLIFGEPFLKFKLTSVGVMTEPLPAAGQVVIKYKKDAETSFTTIFTHNTDDSLFHEAINIESSGVILPEFRELSLRIESTGGAVITGYWAQAEHVPSGFVNRIIQSIRGFIG